MGSSLAAARDTARVRARILRRRRANLADTRPFPLVDRARRACAGRRIAGGGHATHTRARDLACSDAATLLRKQMEKWKPAKCAPPARSSALGSAPRDASPSLSLHDSASHRRGTSRAPRGMRRRKDRAVETITRRIRTFRCTFLETFSPIFATRRFSSAIIKTVERKQENPNAQTERARSRGSFRLFRGPPKKRARYPKKEREKIGERI